MEKKATLTLSEKQKQAKELEAKKKLFEERVIALKEKYKEVISSLKSEALTYIVLDNGMGCILREPELEIAEECTKLMMDSNFVDCGKMLIENCMVIGDSEITDKDKSPMIRVSAYITAAKSFNGIIDGDLKKN